MISNFLINFFLDVLTSVLSIFPSGPSLPTSAIDSIALMVNGAFGFNSFFPVYTLFTVISLMITIEILVVGVEFITWVYRRILK